MANTAVLESSPGPNDFHPQEITNALANLAAATATDRAALAALTSTNKNLTKQLTEVTKSLTKALDKIQRLETTVAFLHLPIAVLPLLTTNFFACTAGHMNLVLDVSITDTRAKLQRMDTKKRQLQPT